MTFALIVGSMTFACLPLVGAGIWLVRNRQTTVSKYSGVVLMVVGCLPLLFTIAFWVWVDFFSN